MPPDEIIPAPVTPAPVTPAPVYDGVVPPDGYYDPTVVDRVVGLAKESGLSPEVAGKLLSVATAEVAKFNESVQAGVEQTVAGWISTTKSDPEIGGTKFDKSLELSKAVLVKFGSEKLIADLQSTRFGNHPELVRLLTRIGKAMKEDDFIRPGSAQSGGKNSPEGLLYDHPSSQSA